MRQRQTTAMRSNMLKARSERIARVWHGQRSVSPFEALVQMDERRALESLEALDPVTEWRTALLARANELGRYDLIAKASARAEGLRGNAERVDAAWAQLERLLDEAA